MGGDDLSEDLAAAAAAIRAQASELPGPGQIRALAEQAVRHGGGAGMTEKEVRALAAKAVQRADQLAGLLRQLSEMVGPAEGDADDRDS